QRLPEPPAATTAGPGTPGRTQCRSRDPLTATMQVQLDAFAEHLRSERHYSPHTLDNYLRDLCKLKDYCEAQGIHHWHALTANDLRHFAATQHRKGLGGRSIQRLLSSARSFYHFVIREGLPED